jgi:murein DD-endopeptidase MepM/ murein hydrolase activator NlpD
VGSSSFYQKIAPRKFRDAEMKMPKTFFLSKVDDLLPKYFKAANLPLRPVDSGAMTNQQLAESFVKVNEDYRKLLGLQIMKMSQASLPQRFWRGVFDKPMPAAPTASFGEARDYSLEGTPAGSSVHWGVDLAQTVNTPFRASNGGKVVLADDFGIYGTTVVLDHGFGLTSLYGHLSSVLVNVGDVVEKGTPLGRTGDTGLAGGDHLHFEIRLHGIPVNPLEWLDDHWIKDHIDLPIESAKRVVLGKGVEDTAPTDPPSKRPGGARGRGT